MSDQKKLIDRVEYFYIDVIEEFKEAEQRIINDSQFRSLFRKKDYDGHIALLKKCKKLVLGIDVRDIKIDDVEAQEVMDTFKRTLTAFNALCNRYIQLQVFLKKKSLKEEAKYSDYKELFNSVQACKAEVNAALHDLDVVYTDYTEDFEAGEETDE